MQYCEVYVMPVIAARLDEYRRAAEASAALWKEFGALAVVEGVIDDLSPGSVTSFPRAVQLKEGETVVCAHISFRDKAHRDEVANAIMQDPRMEQIMADVPADGRRMFWTGFNVIAEA